MRTHANNFKEKRTSCTGQKVIKRATEGEGREIEGVIREKRKAQVRARDGRAQRTPSPPLKRYL